MKILGITLDRNLGFNTHAKNICRKAGQKLRALLRISPYLVQGKKGLLYKSMKKSQFNYCLLVWMYCSRQSNNLMNRVHERGLRLTYRNGIAPPIMSSLFNFRANIHNIRNFLDIFTENRKTVKYCIETATYQAPFLWANPQCQYINAKSLEEFKSKIKTWKCDFCSCRLCKNYIQNFGFFLKNQTLANIGRRNIKNL